MWASNGLERLACEGDGVVLLVAVVALVFVALMVVMIAVVLVVLTSSVLVGAAR